MTSLAQQAVLLSVVFLCGCQSLESLVPWQSASTPNYTAEELAALDSKPVASARAARSNQSQADGDSATSGNGIVQASYSPDSQAAPVSAQRIDQLVRSGQRIIGSGQKDPGKLAEARNYFEQALALDQRNSSAHHGMAIVADLQHDYPTAEFHYKQALSANPSDPDLLNDLGYSYVLQNRFAEASNYLNRVLQISPQHERAKVNMALMSLKRGNRPEAQQILGSVYSPADAQATLVKLDESLQAMQVPAMPNGQMQAPQMAMNSQPGILAPTENGVAQDVLKRMQQERERAEAIRQQQSANASAMAQNQPPVHVYPPGFSDEPAVPNMAPQQQNMGAPMANYGQPQQQWANNGGIPGFPQSLNQNGSQQPAMSNYPNMQPGQPGGQYPNQQFQNQMPQGQYPGSQQQGMVQQFGGGAQPAYQNSMPTQQYQNGLQLPQQNQSGSMGAYGGQSPSVGMPNSPRNAPLAGLNAGPGALFPIGMPQTQQQQQNIYQQPVQQGNNYLPPQPNSGAYQPNGSGNPQAMMPAGNGYGQQVGQPQMQPMQSGPQYQYNTSTASASQPLNQNWQNPQYQNAQPQFNQQPMGQGQYPSAPMPSADPLEAYERQLQSLDNQYNRAVQQMDGNGLGMSPMPSAQY